MARRGTLAWHLAVVAGAFLLAAQGARAQQAGGTVNAGTVNGTGGGADTPVPGATAPPTQQQIFQSGDATRVIDPTMTSVLGPAPSAAQVLQMSPGVNVNSYGTGGASKYSISVDGLGQGWGGFGGYTGGAALQVTFDGVPMNNVVSGLWSTQQLPQMAMISSTAVTYGPGEASNRWYDNIGGQISFTPIQPTEKAGGDLNISYGSYNAENIEFDTRSGNIDGWSSVIAGGLGQGNDYRTGYGDGFASPYSDVSLYTKTIKNFSNGDVSLGGYYAQSTSYRPNVMPIGPNPGIGVYGPGTSPAYSQQSTGFYSALPYNVWNKLDGNTSGMLWSNLNLALDDTTALHNVLWFRDGNRLHRRFDSYFGNTNADYEYNNPNSMTYGDKMDITKKLPYNTVEVGAYYIWASYDTRNAFYNPLDPVGPFPGSAANPTGSYRNDIWNQQDTAAYIQDDISPFKSVHIIPSVRFVNYNLNYNSAAQAQYPNSYQYFPQNNQGLLGPAVVNRTGLEPSIDANWQPVKWGSLFASYDEAYKTPQVGGGGGLFQSVPVPGQGAGGYYGLELAQEAQIGFKVNVNNVEWLNNFLLQANYFHLRYADQQINITNAIGNSITGVGTSLYQGANVYFDDNPAYNWHMFFNGNVESATYTNYQTGSISNPTKYTGLPVPYVPVATANVGSYVKQNVGSVVITPSAWLQFNGSQTIFNNNTGAPSRQAIPQYTTLNVSLDAKVPVDVLYGPKVFDFNLAIMNITNAKFNTYEYVTSGGYFGGGAGSTLAYPGAPLMVMGTVGVSF